MRALLVVLVAASCAPSTLGELRFRNEPPVWRVNDRAPIARRPEERPYHRALYQTDGFFVRRATRAMDMQPPRRAADVNSLGEVPDSTWFTNRIGVREMSIDEVRTGPNSTPGPFAQRPWTITKSKSGGLSIGFIFEDAAGDTYLLKFDEPDRPEMETAAHIIVHRILWACGYNVPEDHVGYVNREDLRLSSKSTKRDEAGNKVPMTDEDLDHALAKVAREADGRYRVLASRYLPGKPIGPYAREGTRPDDQNDRIPHELRRSLRGQRPIFAWLNHTDLQEDNTLDTFVDGHVVHYLVDFGKALGVMGWGMKWQTVGHTYRFDPGFAFKTLVTFGLWKRPWEDIEQPHLRGVGLYEAQSYDPGEWRSNSPYWPLEDSDRFDGFWGAKILIRFTRKQLQAIVEEAQLSDPRAAQYMLETLIARQRKTASHWFDRVAPLDRFVLDDSSTTSRLCFSDLALVHGLTQASTRYELTLFDKTERELAKPRIFRAERAGNTCIAGIAPSSAPNGYTIARLRVQRTGGFMPDVLVHLAQRTDGKFDVIGVRRR
jgi:hypothetical protein